MQSVETKLAHQPVSHQVLARTTGLGRFDNIIPKYKMETLGLLKSLFTVISCIYRRQKPWFNCRAVVILDKINIPQTLLFVN